MKKPRKKLYRTTITIWSEYPTYPTTGQVELEVLAREATSGDALCTGDECVLEDPSEDDGFEAIADFFGIEVDDDDDDDIQITDAIDHHHPDDRH